jgi:hypothetical protein
VRTSITYVAMDVHKKQHQAASGNPQTGEIASIREHKGSIRGQSSDFSIFIRYASAEGVR